MPDFHPIFRALLAAALLVGGAAPGLAQVKAPPRVDKLDVLDKPIAVKDVQALLASSTNPVLRQTRLDRIYFEYEFEDKPNAPVTLYLMFEGFCLDPRCADATAKNDLLRKPLEDEFYKAYPKVKERLTAKLNAMPSSNVKKIRSVELATLPVVEMQGRAVRDNLDGVLFFGTYFNKDRRLVIDGLTGHESQKAGIDKVIKETTDKFPILTKSDDEKMAQAPVVNMPVWKPLALLQGDLAREDRPAALRDLFQPTLVRRVWFTYEVGEKTLTCRCWIDARSIKPDFKPDDIKTLTDHLAGLCKESWGKLSDQNEFNDRIKPRKAQMGDQEVMPVLVQGREIKSATSPVYDLQQRANGEPAIDGALAERAVFDANSTLRLQGYVNAVAHRERFAAFLKEKEGKPPVEWLRTTTWLPGPRWTSEDLKVYPQKLEPPAFQVRLSGSETLLEKQLRVHRLHFEFDGTKPRLRLYGASINPDWSKEEKARTKQGEGLFRDFLVKTWLRDAHPYTLSNELKPEEKPALLNVETLPRVEDPVPGLQQASTRDVKLDGMLFLPAVYDAKAILHYPVLLVRPELEGHRNEAAKLIANVPPDHPCYQPNLKPAAYKLDARPAGPHLQTTLQERLSQSRGYKELRQVRLDRVWFTYAGLDIKKPELRCRGIALFHEEKDKPAPRPRKEVAEKLEQETTTEWGLVEAWDKGVKLKANLEEIEMVPHPGPELQARIARIEALDGTRLNRTADRERYTGEFNEKGVLVLRGQWRDAKQEQTLRELIAKFFSVRPPRPDQNGLILKMEVYKTDEVLLAIRQYAADRLEDVLLQRLYFDDAGEIKLQGFIANEKDRADLMNYLKERLQKQPVSDAGHGPKDIQVARLREFPKLLLMQLPPEAPRDGLTGRPGLTAHLRTLLQASNNLDDAPKAERWDGVLLTRGFYTPKGDYQLVGLLGAEPQRQQIELLLQELSSTQWRDHIPNAFSLEGLQLMPIESFLSRMRIVMPAYSDLDGLTLQRAFHDIQGRLILRVGVIGRVGRDAALTFKKLIDAHPEWKARSAAGVRIQVAGRPQTPDARVVEESLLKAVKNLKYLRVEQALEQATTAILHDPEDSTGWYLRALCFLLRGDIEQAERDLRRTVLLERETVRYPGPRANLRLERLELLQNKYRQMINEGRKKVLNDVESGKPPLQLSRTP